MEEIKVYRIEYKNGRGLYQFGGNKVPQIRDIEGLGDLWNRHIHKLPSAFNDETISPFFKSAYRSKYRFSFNSISDFKKLVKESEFRILVDNGFSAYEIITNDYVQSKYQTIFNINSVKSKIKINIYEQS